MYVHVSGYFITSQLMTMVELHVFINSNMYMYVCFHFTCSFNGDHLPDILTVAEDQLTVWISEHQKLVGST